MERTVQVFYHYNTASVSIFRGKKIKVYYNIGQPTLEKLAKIANKENSSLLVFGNGWGFITNDNQTDS